MFGNLTCMFSFQTCLQSGGKKCVQLLNKRFTVYADTYFVEVRPGKKIKNVSETSQ